MNGWAGAASSKTSVRWGIRFQVSAVRQNGSHQRNRDLNVKVIHAVPDLFVGSSARHQPPRQGHAPKAATEMLPMPASLDQRHTKAQLYSPRALDPVARGKSAYRNEDGAKLILIVELPIPVKHVAGAADGNAKGVGSIAAGHTKAASQAPANEAGKTPTEVDLHRTRQNTAFSVESLKQRMKLLERATKPGFDRGGHGAVL